MKQILVMMAAVVLVGCGEKATSPTPKGKPKIPSPPPVDEKLIVEKAVRVSLEKPEGEITEADLEKVL